MKVKRAVPVESQIKRRLQDVSFYAYGYRRGDLPLDPAKPFIRQQIERLRKSKSEVFRNDLNFRDDVIVDKVYQLPSNAFTSDHPLLSTKSSSSSSSSSSSVSAGQPVKHFIELKPKIESSSRTPSYYAQDKHRTENDVTTCLLALYKEHRVPAWHIFRKRRKRETPVEINRRMRMKFLPKIDALTPYETLDLLNFHIDFDKTKLKPRKRKRHEYTPLPSVQEREAEMAKAQKYIDDLLRPEMLKYQRQREELQQEIDRQHITVRELMEQHVKWKSQREAKKTCPTKRSGHEKPKPRPRKKPINNGQIILDLIKEERKTLAYFEPIKIVDVEVQRDRQLNAYRSRAHTEEVRFTPEMRDTFLALMNQICVEDIQPFPSHLIMAAIPKINPKLKYLTEAYKYWKTVRAHTPPEIRSEVILMDFLFDPDRMDVRLDDATMIIALLIDLQEDFRDCVRRDFLSAVLQNAKSRELLAIEPPPSQFPVITIRAPVPWKCAIQVATNRLDQVLMVCHPVVQAVNMLWYELYDDLIVVNTKRVYKSEVPLDAESLTALIDDCCEIAKEILLDDWLPRIADLIDTMREFWRDLVVPNSAYGGRAATLFKAIHALMSLQLQRLIKKSVDHLLKTLLMYSDGNHAHALDPENAHSKRHPFMTLKVSVVGKSTGEDELKFAEDSIMNQQIPEDPKLQLKQTDFPQPAALPKVSFIIKNNGKLLMTPYIEQLPEIFVDYFKCILRVGHEIPRMEYFMSGRADEIGYLHYIREDHSDMLELYEQVRKVVAANQDGPKTYLKPIYDYYYPILSGKMLQATENLFLKDTLPPLSSFQELMEHFKELLYEAYYLRSYVPLNMFMLDNRNVNKVLVNMVNGMKDFITDYFRTKNLVENRKLCDEFEDISLHAGERPKETPEVVALQNYLNECRDERMFTLKAEIKLVAERVLFLLHYATLDVEDIHLNSRTFLWPSELAQVLDLSAARLNVIREGLETALRERRAQFEVQLLQEKKKVDAFRSREIRDVLSLDELREKVETVDGLCAILKDCTKEAKAINVDENLLQIDQSFFPVLTELVEKMDPIEKLWHTAFQFDSKYEGWFFGPIEGLIAIEIRLEVEAMSEIINSLTKQLVANPQAKRTAEQIRIKIDKFKVYLPILEAICKEGLSDRHWRQISEELGQPVNPEDYKTLASLVEIDIMRIAEQLQAISYAAGKEFELNIQLQQMQSEWTDIQFDITQYRDSDTMILAAVDDVQTLLDDHILKAQAMRGSPYIAALGAKATSWEDKLISMQDILDVWLKVQSTWMYLEPIFNSEDIMRQMPTEGRNFKSVDRIWRKIMKHTETEKRVIQTTDYPNMLETLQKSFVDLECIQKGLNMYLEKKRLYFTRFYFLSNDELLEILSETKDPLRVQPHLKKCFEGINSLQFDQNMEIIGMVSADNEVVSLTKKINPASANGLVEKWLREVQLIMVDSIQDQLRSAYDIYYASVRKNWCLKWPGQIVHTIASLTWTSDVEEAIEKFSLPKYLEKCESQLEEDLALVRSDLNPRNSTTIQSLIIFEIHCVNILKTLVADKVDNIHDFNWMAQLRYNWRVDEIDKLEYIFVSMVTTDVQYGLEYLGNMQRLIMTPMTDRCFRTLMTAIKFNLAGCPEGPAGSGKTETCKDLSKAVGKKCVVFNCAEGLDHKAVGKFLKGLAQCGAWACFDEFNRIEVDVLSVLAHQILTIQRAIAKKAVKFMFEDSNLKLDPSCSIFVTITPTPTNTNRLPDNLKVLFRTVALTTPDMRPIAEVTLFSKGFAKAKELTDITLNFFKLTSELLSSQCHYDFGMRTMKSILRNIALLKANKPKMSEVAALHQTIYDLFVAGLVGTDLQIFESIRNQLFSEVHLNIEDESEIVTCIEAKMRQKNLQVEPRFVQKMVQLYNMIQKRHGVMLIGEPMSGKTTCYQVLADVLRDLHKDPKSSVHEMPVSSRVINPKAITVGQLYGYVDAESDEWVDGVLAKTFRDMANTTVAERQWIIFDGPVDELWIENLNTVLDDNRKLCLTSGEIIQMSKDMTLLFEPVDLRQVSPATISRCGMIYLDRDQLGWRSIHLSFMDELKNARRMPENYLHLFEVLIDWLVEALLEILNVSKCVLKVSPIYQYKMFRAFFTHFIATQTQFNQTWFQQVFLFCLVWAHCSTLTGEGRREVDPQLRRILYGSNEKHPKPKLFTLNRGQIFPEKMNFMDYRYDGVETWWPWLKNEETHLHEETAALFEVLVPTTESCMVAHWLEFLMRLDIPFLVIGPAGCGKTAIINDVMRALPKEKYLLNGISLSANTVSQQMQELIMAKLDRRRKGVFGPSVGKKCLIFVDDLAIPTKDICGSQPPLELLRQWADHRTWSDLKDTSKLELIDLLYVAAMGLIGGTNHIYERLHRHMFIVALDTVDYATMQRIYNVLGEWHFSKDNYPEVLLKQAKALCAGILDVYQSIKQTFLPTPEKTHYTFSMLDISRVYQGIAMVPAKRLQDSEKLVRLWAHETYRVFADRLLEQEERVQLFNILQGVCSSKMRMSLTQAFGEKVKGSERLSESHMRDLVFGSFMEPDADPKIYDEVDDIGKLERTMQFYLNEYNSAPNAMPMDLVLFQFAMEHIARVSRVLQMPKGNVLLFGMGGSGRRSAVKLAATITDAKLFQAEVTQTYDYGDWIADIKKVLLSAGFDYRKTVFLFTDSQAKHPQFFEDIHFLLNSYDLNNIFSPEEKMAILDHMQNEAKALNKNIESTPLALYGFFNERVQEKLHLALVFSSIGQSFQNYLRVYPALRNCCTMDFVSDWPRDALVRVAEHFIMSMDLDAKSNGANTTEEEEEHNQSPTIDRVLSDLEQKLIGLVMYFNKSALLASKRFCNQFKRKLYITPTLYLELLHLLKTFHAKKFEEITTLRDRYVIGLEKLDSAAKEVEVMQTNLFELQPQLKVLSEETERIMVNIERETAEAEKKKEVVGADEAAANESAASAQAIKDDCESDLQEAIPALSSALAALDTLKPADITVVKSMKNPPLPVKLVLEAVCVIKGIKADRKTDPTGKVTEDFWAPSLRMLGDLKFLDSLKTFDKDNISVPVMKKIRDRFIVDREFVPEKIKSVSMACEGLCRWVRAIEVYDRVAKIVAPKKLALAEAEAELAQQMEKLNAKRAELQDILDKLQKLNDFFAEKSREKKRLEDEIDNCEKKLFRAERLLGGLGGEKVRWSERAAELHKSLENVVGDVLLAAGTIAYLGPFVTEYRNDIIRDWNANCIAEQIPCSEQFKLKATLAHSRQWNLCGLPTDEYSIDNGIIVMNARRYPLMIDPQGQANKWIKRFEKENNIQVIKQTDSNYMEVVSNALFHGYPVLLENVDNQIDPGLYPILEKNIVKRSDVDYVKFGGEWIEIHPTFRFYITTSIKNPHYLPDIAVLVTILSFTLTDSGLRDQLLATVVNQEKPDLQEKKEMLIVETAHNYDSLYKIETEILQVLSTEGNILEDENAINVLSSSKALSEEISAKQLSAEATEAEIDMARKQYLPVAEHSSVLFFCIIELANVDVMYQYSLLWYLKLFTQTIIRSPKSDVLTDRMSNLNKCFTLSVYQNICRSLYERHKLMFSFLMTIGMLRSKKQLDEQELATFLGCHLPCDGESLDPNSNFEWLRKDAWISLGSLEPLERFKGIQKSFLDNKSEWQAYVLDMDQNNRLNFPQPFNGLKGLSALVLLKILKPEWVLLEINRFIVNHMGEEFVEPPPFDIRASFADTTSNVPLVFLLSDGSDPMDSVLSLARERSMLEKTKTISLGQDQGAKALKVVEDCMQMGHWIVLQNCHMSGAWMNTLEMLFMTIGESQSVHPDFRMVCSTKSCDTFPVTILQNSVKVTNEPPKSLKMNMLRLYNSHLLPAEPVFNKNSTKQHLESQVLNVLFGMVFFHAMVLERKQYGPLGWNILYEFNESDLSLSIEQLQMFCKQFERVPFKGHQYLMGECNYGGRVTDLNDRRLLWTLLDNVYGKNVLDMFSITTTTNSSTTPFEATKANVLQFINNLPMACPPEVIGLHANANILKSVEGMKHLLDGTRLTQIELLARFHVDIEDKMSPRKGRTGNLNLCQSILAKVPEQLDERAALENFPPINHANSLNIVLHNEILRYNKLVFSIGQCLNEMIRALRCEVNMNFELAEMERDLMCQRIPRIWLRYGYNSRKSVTCYIADLVERVKFFRTWIEDGEPASMWISAFYYPQSLLTALLRNYAVRSKLPIDRVYLDMRVTEYEVTSKSNCSNFSDFVRESCRANEDFKVYPWKQLDGTERVDIWMNRYVGSSMTHSRLLASKRKADPPTDNQPPSITSVQSIKPANVSGS